MLRLDKYSTFDVKLVLMGASVSDRNGGSNWTGGKSRLKTAVQQVTPYHVLSVGETHVFSPTLVNQFRGGFSRLNQSANVVGSDWSTPVLGAAVMERWGYRALTTLPT